jgi:hypothetical protein
MLHKCRATFSTNKLKSLYNNCNGIKSTYQWIISISAVLRQGLCQKKIRRNGGFFTSIYFFIGKRHHQYQSRMNHLLLGMDPFQHRSHHLTYKEN